MWQYVWTIDRRMNFKQKPNIKFCFKLGKTSAETHQMMQKVYGDECLFRSTIYEWFKRFEESLYIWRESKWRPTFESAEIYCERRKRLNCVWIHKKRAKIFVALYGNAIEYIQRFNSSHFDWVLFVLRGLFHTDWLMTKNCFEFNIART